MTSKFIMFNKAAILHDVAIMNLENAISKIENHPGYGFFIIEPAFERYGKRPICWNHLLFRISCLGAGLVAVVETIAAVTLTVFSGLAAVAICCQNKNLNRTVSALYNFSKQNAAFTLYLWIAALIHHKVSTDIYIYTYR